MIARAPAGAVRGSPGEACFTVCLPGPLDVARSVEFLRRNGDDLMDRWDGTRLTRLLVVGGERIPVSLRPAGTLDEPELQATVPAGFGAHAGLRTALARQFATCPADWAELLRTDAPLAAREAATPGIRPLGLTDPLYSLVRSITAQQINLKFANRLRERLARAYGVAHRIAGTEVYGIDADRLAGAQVTELRALQLSERKATYLIGVAAECAAGRIDLAELAPLEDEELLRRLVRLHGIGRWTAEWFGARMLFRPMLVAGDVALRKAVGRLYEVDRPGEAMVRELAAHWAGATHLAQQVALETCA